MSAPLVNASKSDGVMALELSNPPANTYSYEMMRDLDGHVLDARMDESIHVLLIIEKIKMQRMMSPRTTTHPLVTVLNEGFTAAMIKALWKEARANDQILAFFMSQMLVAASSTLASRGPRRTRSHCSTESVVRGAA